MVRVPRLLSLVVVLLMLAGQASAQELPPLLARTPTVSADRIVFACAGDLWVVPRAGGQAIRLTAGDGEERSPFFSPDGTQVAFTGEYDGNVDVFVVLASGGVPRRLTYHPGTDEVAGWTPDGKAILFQSRRDSHAGFARLYTISIQGGFPAEVPLPIAAQGAFSPDGSRIAYIANSIQRSWKRYRGGKTPAVVIASLTDSAIVDRVPRQDSNDFNPMWVGDTVYFLSDREGPVTLFAYDTAAKRVRRAIENKGLDIKSASAGPGVIIYEQFGGLYLYDLAGGSTQRVPVAIAADLEEVRPGFRRVSAGSLRGGAISPTGARAVFQARGEIITVPREKGAIRNLTNTSGIAERDPAWSPDGKWIAYFSDDSGEYALHLRDQSGGGDVRKIDLGEPPSFFYGPVWSPDSKKIAYTDKRVNLWYVNIDGGKPVKVDTNPYNYRSLTPAWSPDSRWLTYSRHLRNHMRAVFVYSLEQAKSWQLTDGMSDAAYPVFDAGGRYLCFTASTDAGLAAGWLDMTSLDRRTTRGVYLAVLRKEDSSPLAPESDEEKVQERGRPAATQPASQPVTQRSSSSVRIDFADIDQRIIALPIPVRDYIGVAAGKANELWLLEGRGGESETGNALHKFDLAKRKLEKVLDNVRQFSLSQNKEKLLYRQADAWFIASTAAVKAGEGALRLSDIKVHVDPVAEWKQMYREVWRIERDFLYDPGHHGLDLAATARFYEPYLNVVVSRDDLNYLFEEMLGNLVLGHVYIRGGDSPAAKTVGGGLLGADYAVANGRYRIVRVLRGENWNPDLRAPLTAPGVNVKAGEYLLAVQGRELRGTDNIFSFFEETADKPIVLKVGPNADGSKSREVTVVPIGSEYALRHREWIESNRRLVDRMTDGKVAYVYLPNTGSAGVTNFNRYYFGQIGKEAAIIDERFNGGGKVADYMVDFLRRPLLCGWTMREGGDATTPLAAIFGPKVMLINESAGSGGDALPWMFRKLGIGPLIGRRTWGGLVGIGGYPELIDGGSVTAPHLAFYNPDGKWEIENHGVAPDIDVEWDPKAWRDGRDSQLEKALETVMKLLKENPPPTLKKPAYPNYHSMGGGGR